MALNPPISPVGVPLRVDQEYFVLYRNDMECEVKIQGMGKFTAYGKIYLTTCRIVFVNDKFQKDSFKSFDFPLAYLTREKFEQPIFGSNYLEGDVDPLYNLLPGKTHFKLWFKSGGCDRFLRLLVDILKQIRRNRSHGNMVPDPRYMENFARTQSQAYMDPNDPSVIYVQQPQLSQQSYGNTTWGIPQNQNKVFPADQPIQQQQPPPPQYNPGPQVGQPVSYPEFGNQPNQYNQPPYQQNPYSQPPYQPPPQQFNQPFNQPPPAQQYNQFPNQNQFTQPPPAQQYNPYNQQPQQPQQPPQPQNQPPAQQFNYPPPQPPQQEPQPNQQQPQPNQQQPDQIRNQPNMAYYYGFWGPQLNSNQNAIL